MRVHLRSILYLIITVTCISILLFFKDITLLHRRKGLTHMTNYSFNTIADATVCKEEDIYLVIAYVSSVGNFKLRTMIRKHWMDSQREHLVKFQNGSFYKLKTGNGIMGVQIMFFVGISSPLSKDNDTQILLAKEKDTYGDVIQGAFWDTYNNLTTKSLFLLKYVSINCKQARYLLKIDDNVLLHFERLLDVLQGEGSNNISLDTSDFIMGYLKPHEKPIRFNHKNRMSLSMYNQSYYPDYVAGPAYLMPTKVITKLWTASHKVAKLPLEDVFITGLCREEAGIQIIDNRNFCILKIDKNKNCISEHTRFPYENYKQ